MTARLLRYSPLRRPSITRGQVDSSICYNQLKSYALMVLAWKTWGFADLRGSIGIRVPFSVTLLPIPRRTSCLTC